MHVPRGSYTLLTLQRVMAAGRGSRRGAHNLQGEVHLKEEAHLGDPNYSQDTEDLVLYHVPRVLVRMLQDTRGS